MIGNLAWMSDADPPGALHGIRVLEVGHLIGGPFVGHLFADHGAEVIKIEPPGAGDPMRHWGGIYRGVGLYWSVIGRGKKSVELDLRSEDGQATFRRLVETADVVVENFRPGTLERWALGWDDLHRINPRLVMVRVTGYGQDGPYADRAGFGLIAEAMSGFRHVSGEPGRAPVRVGISIGDTTAGTFGFIGALMALWQRDRPGGSGQGQMVDVALYEAMWSHMESTAAEFDLLSSIRQPTGSALPGIAPSNTYPTRDDDWVLIGANQDTVFRRLAELVGRPEWAAPDSPYATHEGRGRRQAELDGLIGEWTAEHNLDEVLALLANAGVPAGRVYDAADIVVDPHFRAREMLLEVPEPNLDGERVLHPGVVPKLSGTPGRVTRGAPILGEHTREVLEALDERVPTQAEARR